MTQKTILFAGHGSGLNGAERCMHETASALVRLGYRVHILLPDAGLLSPMLREAGVEAIHNGAMPWWFDLGTRCRWIAKLKRLLQIGVATMRTAALIHKLKPDTVISNTLAIPSTALAAFLLNIPHVWYIHELGREDHGYHFLFGETLSMRLISLLSSLVLVNSKRVAAKFLEVVPASKLRRIPYAVNVPQELSGYRDDLKQNGPFSLIIAGRVTPEKGQRAALQAISILLKQHRITQFKLMILGAQPDDAEVRVIQAFIDKESLQAHVEILPFTKEPLQLIRSCHVLLMCSQCEAFGRVTVEAMKLGLVVVGSNTGGTLDIVQHDVNGLLYESGNVEDLAQKIADVISDPIKRTRLSLNATMHAHQTFSEQTHEHALNEALRCIASPPSTREDRLKGKLNPAGTAAANSSRRPSSAVAIEN